jgi:integrase
MALDSHWRPRFGHQALGSIGPRQIQEAVNDLAVTHRSSSVRTYYGTLRSLLKYAVERDVIGRSPCRSIKLPAAEQDERRVISPAEVHRLADAIDDRWRCMIYLAGVMGLRFGEVAALRCSDLSLKTAELFVRRTLVERSGSVEFGAPKSVSSVRSLIVPEPLVDELAGHLIRYRVDGDELLFLGRGGRPLRRSRFRHDAFLPAVTRAGLDGVTFHGLRHSAATSWVADGVDLRTVQAWLGHSDPQLVLRLYAHASDAASRSAAEIVTGSYWPNGH